MPKSPAAPGAGHADDTELLPFPPVANALIVLAASNDVCLADVTEILSADAAVSAELLRVANSAFVGVRGEVDSIIQAAAILGLKRVSRLAATIALRDSLGKLWQAKVVRRCWQHNLATALMAETMARMVSADPHAAYTSGLLHDTGRLALIVKHRDDYVQMLRTPLPPGSDYRQLEQERFGTDHTRVGMLLAEKLRLPKPVCEAVGHHHDVPTADSAPMATFIHVACGLATARGYGLSSADVPELDQAHVDALIHCLPGSICDTLMREQYYLYNTVRELVSAYEQALSPSH